MVDQRGIATPLVPERTASPSKNHSCHSCHESNLDRQADVHWAADSADQAPGLTSSPAQARTTKRGRSNAPITDGVMLTHLIDTMVILIHRPDRRHLMRLPTSSRSDERLPKYWGSMGYQRSSVRRRGERWTNACEVFQSSAHSGLSCVGTHETTSE
jgi:hypothetical protein